jgi:hypothetical protein
MGLAFGSDGQLYVGTGNTGLCDDSFCNAVLRYDGTSGEFLDVFVTSGSGGLNDPLDIEFGPDGNLYARSVIPDGSPHSAQVVLRFDGTTGAFIDRFVEGDEVHLQSITGFDFGNDEDLYVLENNSGLIDQEAVLRYDGSSGGFIEVFITSGQSLNSLERPIFIEFARSQFPAVPSLSFGGWALLTALVGVLAAFVVIPQRRDAGTPPGRL